MNQIFQFYASLAAVTMNMQHQMLLSTLSVIDPKATPAFPRWPRMIQITPVPLVPFQFQPTLKVVK